MLCWIEELIFEVFDYCCDECVFLMLDNGYVYFVVMWLFVFVGQDDWVLVIEVFGYLWCV